jgi:prepilin-type N-terminal cleavage/methylation domain-containing protein
MIMFHSNRFQSEAGFTLMEVVVATAVFATVVVAMLGLFDYTLKINRRVQALRQVSQGTRNFTESLTREIRNGRIDYGSAVAKCDPSNYFSNTNKSVAIITQSGDRLCFYLNADQTIHVIKSGGPIDGGIAEDIINPTGFKIIPSTFRFIVRPNTDPNPESPPYIGQQPLVTIIAQFKVQPNSNQTATIIPYQTTISTDVYDIPHFQP